VSYPNVLLLGTVAIAAALVFVVWAKLLRRSGSLAAYQDHLVDDTSRPGKGAVRVTSLGTTVMLVDDGDTQILIDAFLTPIPPLCGAPRTKGADQHRGGRDRPRTSGCGPGQRHFRLALPPRPRVRLAHIARHTGAVVYGSESTLNIARGGGVSPDKRQPLRTDEPVTVGRVSVRTLVSEHTPNPVGGEKVPIATSLSQPAKVTDYTEGEGTFDFLVVAEGQSLLFKGAANVADGVLADVTADVLFLSVATIGKADPAVAERYFDATIGATGPALLVPTHWNDFFAPATPRMPFHRRIVDDTSAAFDRLLARQESGVREFEVAILDAFSSVVVPRAGSRNPRGTALPAPRRTTGRGRGWRRRTNDGLVRAAVLGRPAWSAGTSPVGARRGRVVPRMLVPDPWLRSLVARVRQLQHRSAAGRHLTQGAAGARPMPGRQRRGRPLGAPGGHLLPGLLRGARRWAPGRTKPAPAPVGAPSIAT